jgi:hypothetical protein
MQNMAQYTYIRSSVMKSMQGVIIYLLHVLCVYIGMKSSSNRGSSSARQRDSNNYSSSSNSSEVDSLPPATMDDIEHYLDMLYTVSGMSSYSSLSISMLIIIIILHFNHQLIITHHHHQHH